jgi:hypothetical protein
MVRERASRLGPGEQAKTRARFSGGLFGGDLQVGVGASFPFELHVLRLHVALLVHLVHLQLELAAVTDELG